MNNNQANSNHKPHLVSQAFITQEVDEDQSAV